jgi:hypothetical protein
LYASRRHDYVLNIKKPQQDQRRILHWEKVIIAIALNGQDHKIGYQNKKAFIEETEKDMTYADKPSEKTK